MLPPEFFSRMAEDCVDNRKQQQQAKDGG